VLTEAVLKTAQPYLQGRKVRDAVIGISLIGVELDNGSVGVSYVLRDELEAGCSIFPYGQYIIGQDAVDIAQWVVLGEDSLQKSVGIAVLGAASREQNLDDSETPDRPFGISIRDSDTIGMIGLIPPVAKMRSLHARKLHVFDKGISQCGGSKGDVLPIEEQSRLLSTCDIVMLMTDFWLYVAVHGRLL
jgi:hypothetical protein